MKFICTEDIEILAAQGKKELVVDDSTVLMDLARDMARQLGIVIVNRDHPAHARVTPPPAPAAPARAASPVAPAPSAREAAPRLGAKPKGCQHAPLPVAPARPAQAKSHPNGDEMVDQVVELVRQSTGKRSGN